MKKYSVAIQLLSMILAVVFAASAMAGCGNKTVLLYNLPKEEQILKDSYPKNDEITEFLTYRTVEQVTSYYSSYSNSYRLFDPFHIQIDCLNTLTLGQTTLDAIIKDIDASNQRIITDKRSKIEAERQAEIDEKYNNAKAAAEAKGKTYTKPKPEVDLSDLNFGDTYSYSLYVTGSNSNNKDIQPQEYSPSYLVDPKTANVIQLDIYKYNIPYVQLFFRSASLYNDNIKQESDWIFNEIKIADVSGMVDTKTNTLPMYVGKDNLNEGAKINTFMSGDISFGGEGFNWESLRTFCQSIGLTEGQSSYSMTYEQSSEGDFTYYTIKLPIYQHMEKGGTVPVITLVATFDRTTQNCITWAAECYSNTLSISGDNLKESDPVTVNVHEFKVNTKEYKKKLEDIEKFINEHKVDAVVKYVFINSDGSVYGTANSGLLNAYISPSIDGEKYTCIEDRTSSGKHTGYFIKQAEYDKLKAKYKNESEFNDAVSKKAVNLELACLVYEGSGKNSKPFAYMDKTAMLRSYSSDGENYYLYNYEWNETNGFTKATVINQECLDNLIDYYIRIFELDDKQIEGICSAFNNNYALGMKQWIEDTLIAEAKIAEEFESKALVKTMPNNTSDIEKLDKVMIGEKTFSMGTLTTDKLTTEEFVLGDAAHLEDNQVFQSVIHRAVKTLDNKSSLIIHYSATTSTLKGLMVKAGDTNAEMITFYNGLKLGMKNTEFDPLVVGATEYDYGTIKYYAFKNTKNALIVKVQANTITEIYAITAAEMEDWRGIPEIEG